MTTVLNWDPTLLAGLKALADSSFPKRCANCGRIYESADDYVAQTVPISAQKSGLKQSSDDDGRTIVELYRNCACGSTLMDFFNDRRDMSEAGAQRRERFNELLTYLIGRGLERAVARAEMLKVMHGEQSEILRVVKPQEKS